MNPVDTRPAFANTTTQDQLKSKLADLVELDTAQQQSALAELALTQPELAAELGSLLGHAQATLPSFSAPGRLLEELQQSSLPEVFGQWRVLGELGRGGMGVVLRGKRADGAFDKEVAIKVLPPLMATAEAGERFLQEARLLAPLDHPNIARLIDAGMAQGCAYFVMDLVEGLPINRQARPLPLKDRLKLFLQLCAALSFAHGRLLVHRDIKPANVLVDSLGNVRLLDFGIAKLMGEGDVTRTAHNQAFTPSYASPEQLQGQSIGVTSDVFSMGVLLYELCTNAHPFLSGDSASSGSVSTTPNTLSVMVAMLERQVANAPMQRAQLAADLQAVLYKTLEKDPARRYGSVDALAADIEAYLAGLPVKAQTPTWRYQAGKFVKRHAGAVSMAAVTTVTILGLSAWSIFSAKVAREQTLLAQKRLESVREIANKVVFDYNKALEPITGTLGVRKTIVQDALGYLEAQAKEVQANEVQGTDAQANLTLKAEIARGFEAVGDVQGGGLATSNLGDYEGAASSFRKALVLREEACKNQPGRMVAVNFATPLPACSAQAATHLQLAENFMASNQAVPAIEQASRARTLNAQVLAAKAYPSEAASQVQALQYKALRILGGISVRQTGEGYASGLTMAQEAMPIAQSLADADPSMPAQVRLRDAADFLGNRLLAAGQPQAALPHIEAAVALARKIQLAQPSPANAGFTASSLIVLAELKQQLLKTSEAQAHALEATEMIRNAHLGEPNNMMFKGRYVAIGRRSGTVFNMGGDKLAHATSLRLLGELSQMSEAFTPKEAVFYYQHQLVVYETAKAAYALGDVSQAKKLLQRFADSGAANPRAAQDLANVYVLKAQLAEHGGDLQGARALFDLAAKPLKANAQQTPANKAGVAQWAIACQWASRSKAMAAQAGEYKQCVADQRKSLSDSNALTPWWAKQLQNS